MTEPQHVPYIRRIARILEELQSDPRHLGRLSADRLAPPSVPVARRLRPDDRRAAEALIACGAVRVVRGRYGVSLWDFDEREHESDLLAEVRGAVEALQTDYWFSHATAALLHGCWLYRTPPVVHLTQLGHPHVAVGLEPMVRRHHTRLPERDRSEADGIPVTTIERAVVDCLRTLTPVSGLVIADSAFRRGADPWVVSQIMTESAGKRGVVRARRGLDLCDPRSASPGETITRFVAMDEGLPRPECQIDVATASGTYVVDIGWAGLKLAIEFDGDVKYAEDEEEVRRAQARRQAALEAEGWMVIRVSWADLVDLAELGVRIRNSWTERAGRRPRAEV
jgi:hypothetical protein